MNRLLHARALRLLPAAAIVVAALLVGCYPGGPESASDLGMVVTARNPGADLQGLGTFAMRDEVYVLEAPGGGGEPIDARFNPVILQELRSQMTAAGFQDVTPDTATVDPDLWLGVGAVQTEVWFYWYDWGYWGGWCCYYPPYVGVGSFEKGSVVWQLVDVRNAGQQEPQAVWLAAINGAVQDSNTATEAGIRKGIGQAFTQSPYIQASPSGQ